MEQSDIEVFKFYADYLATQGYRRPKTPDSFLKRNDKKFFYKLFHQLKADNNEQKKGRSAFLHFVFTNMPEYYTCIEMVTRFEAIYEKYKKQTYTNDLAYLKRLYDSFQYIKKYMEDVSMSDPRHYFDMGNPPLAIKHYKEGFVDDAIVIFGCDIKALKKKPWFTIYVGELKNKLPNLKTRLQYSPKVKKLIQDAFNKLYEGEFVSPLYPKKTKKRKENKNEN
jgi:hypothetical protein